MNSVTLTVTVQVDDGADRELVREQLRGLLLRSGTLRLSVRGYPIGASAGPRVFWDRADVEDRRG